MSMGSPSGSIAGAESPRRSRRTTPWPSGWRNYPILNESDYCSREYEATIENLPNAAWRLKREYELPEGWEGAVYDWFVNNDCSAIESSDDQGGYPSEEQLRAAFEALG